MNLFAVLQGSVLAKVRSNVLVTDHRTIETRDFSLLHENAMAFGIRLWRLPRYLHACSMVADLWTFTVQTHAYYFFLVNEPHVDYQLSNMLTVQVTKRDALNGKPFVFLECIQ